MVNWPAVIKYKGDDELTYIASQSEWDSDASLHSASYDERDVLIDSSGNIYGFLGGEGKLIELKKLNKLIELEDLVSLVQKHASSIGECCSGKMGFGAIQDAISAIENLGD